MNLSDLSGSFHTLADPRFPFLQLFQHHPMRFLEGEEALSSALSDDVIHSFAGNKKTPPPKAPTPNPSPAVQDLSSCIPEVRHVF